MPSAFDQHMMDIALRVARRGLGQVAPNPAVGAVIADELAGVVISRGWTQPGGRPHAETEAIRRAGEAAQGKTMYVTLEPCSHFGKTPPCADAIIAAGLKRVAVGLGDPDARVAGQGISRLRDAGLEVDEGLRADEARWLTLGHILRSSRGRPFVQVKMALSEHGDVARGADGRPVWVTGPLARAHGHLLRAEADAIIIGAGTLRDDDPELTCRLPGLQGRSPIRVVVSSDLNLSSGAKMFDTARQVPVWVVAGQNAPETAAAALEAKGVQVLRCPHDGADHLQPLALLEALAARGITRVLIEGGPGLWQAFSRAGLIDEVVVYQATGLDGTSLLSQRFVNLDPFDQVANLILAQDAVSIFRNSKLREREQARP